VTEEASATAGGGSGSTLTPADGATAAVMDGATAAAIGEPTGPAMTGEPTCGDVTGGAGGACVPTSRSNTARRGVKYANPRITPFSTVMPVAKISTPAEVTEGSR
jgi:hypothetical protein